MLFYYPYMCVKGKSNIHQLKYYTSFLPDDFTHLPLRPPPSPFLSFAMQLATAVMLDQLTPL